MTTETDPFATIPNASDNDYAATELETGQERALRQWTGLRDEIERIRTAHYEVAVDLSDEGKDAERAFGKVDAYDDVLLRMARIGDGS